MQRVLLRLLWVAAWLRRLAGFGAATKVHTTPLKGLIACEACNVREATVVVPSGERVGGVYFCEWCHRRWRKANQRLAIPKTRRPSRRPTSGARKGGGDGGDA